MSFKATALAAAIAAACWGSAYAQTEETSPPSSTTQDMQEPAAPMDSTAPNDGAAGSTAPGTAAPGATSPSNDEMTAGQAAPVDQKKVEQFADAYVQVQTIQQKANAELQSATDPAQADQVKTTAQSDMIAAVERSGLQIEEFNQIVASMAADTELRSRVSAEVQKRIGGQSAPDAGT
jgi:hypothetical protein